MMEPIKFNENAMGVFKKSALFAGHPSGSRGFFAVTRVRNFMQRATTHNGDHRRREKVALSLKLHYPGPLCAACEPESPVCTSYSTCERAYANARPHALLGVCERRNASASLSLSHSHESLQATLCVE